MHKLFLVAVSLGYELICHVPLYQIVFTGYSSFGIPRCTYNVGEIQEKLLLFGRQVAPGWKGGVCLHGVQSAGLHPEVLGDF